MLLNNWDSDQYQANDLGRARMLSVDWDNALDQADWRRAEMFIEEQKDIARTDKSGLYLRHMFIAFDAMVGAVRQLKANLFRPDLPPPLWEIVRDYLGLKSSCVGEGAKIDLMAVASTLGTRCLVVNPEEGGKRWAPYVKVFGQDWRIGVVLASFFCPDTEMRRLGATRWTLDLRGFIQFWKGAKLVAAVSYLHAEIRP